MADGDISGLQRITHAPHLTLGPVGRVGVGASVAQRSSGLLFEEPGPSVYTKPPSSRANEMFSKKKNRKGLVSESDLKACERAKP